MSGKPSGNILFVLRSGSAGTSLKNVVFVTFCRNVEAAALWHETNKHLKLFTET
jgi:hypothetical protein